MFPHYDLAEKGRALNSSFFVIFILSRFPRITTLLVNYKKEVITINFIDEKIIIPMNNFADKHPKGVHRFQLAVSIIALIVSIAK